MKRSSIRRGRSAASKRKAAAAECLDSKWRSLADVRLMLGDDKYFWPKPNRDRDPRPCRMFHQLHPRCWIDPSQPSEAHHGAAGYLRTKTDDMSILFALCRYWHERVNTSELPLGALLWLKWKNDWPHCDYFQMTLLFGHFLPALQPFRVVK